MASQISQAIKSICDEKMISEEAVLLAIESALAAAYRKDFGNKNQNIQCEFDAEKYDGDTGGIRIFDVKEVVEDTDLPDDYFENFDQYKKEARDKQALKEAENTSETPIEEAEPIFNPKTMIMLSDARDLTADTKIGDEIRVELNIPEAFGRMAAQTAKQVIMQKLREAERDVIFQDFKEREGELMNVVVQRREGRIVLIDLGRATGVILPEDQIESERYYAGTRIKAILREVTQTTRGPEIRLSRSSPGLVAALCAQEIPEIANGVVEIHDIAREAGARTKVAVSTGDEMIDPIGSCIGQRGTRIQSVIKELGGEKVDIVLWSDDDEEYIVNSLSPAKVLQIKLNYDQRLATIQVDPEQLSLAIGKGGQNVRLAAKLTGWKITVVNEKGEEVKLDAPIKEDVAITDVKEEVVEEKEDVKKESDVNNVDEVSIDKEVVTKEVLDSDNKDKQE